MIQIFNAQPVKIPHFKSMLTRKQAWSPHFLNCMLLRATLKAGIRNPESQVIVLPIHRVETILNIHKS